MAKIEFFHADDGTFIRARDMAGPPDDLAEWARVFTDEELDGTWTRLICGGPESLEAFEVRQDPGVVTQPHAHDEDEVIYVLEGALEVGNRSYPAGSVVTVPAMTLYAFRSGPDGLRFLNFRARRTDRPYISRAELLAHKAAARSRPAQ